MTTKPKPESMKCSNCAWSTIKAMKHPNVIYTMKRLYIRKGVFTPIGWYCRNCGSVVLDEFKKRKAHFPIPDAKITATKIIDENKP